MFLQSILNENPFIGHIPYLQDSLSDMIATDISETKNQYIFEMDLPRFEKENISITVDKDILTVKANVQQEKEKENTNYHLRERIRCNNSVNRSFELPENADTNTVKANFKKGVLTITIDKKEPDKDIKTIEIN